MIKGACQKSELASRTVHFETEVFEKSSFEIHAEINSLSSLHII